MFLSLISYIRSPLHYELRLDTKKKLMKNA